MKFLCTLVVLLLLPPSLPARSAVLAPTLPYAGCSASAALNAVADALTTGSDGNVLAAALAGEKRLTACGNERDAVGAELIAADAYGDVNRAGARCAALHNAAQRSAKLGETLRARMIENALKRCAK